MSGDDASAESADPAPLRLVRGEASAEELAALVAVLSAASAGAGPAPAPRPRSQWASRARVMRSPLTPGPGAWRASALPR